MMKIIKSNLFWRICWLIGFDFLFKILSIYLGIYYIGVEKLRNSDNLPLIYDICWWFPFLISPIYFMIWHKWREIFIKSIIIFLANMVTFDTQIMTISELFSHEMIKLIFSEKSLEIYIMLLIMILITYNISVVILKIIEYVKDKKVYDENSKK